LTQQQNEALHCINQENRNIVATRACVIKKLGPISEECSTCISKATRVSQIGDCIRFNYAVPTQSPTPKPTLTPPVTLSSPRPTLVPTPPPAPTIYPSSTSQDRSASPIEEPHFILYVCMLIGFATVWLQSRSYARQLESVAAHVSRVDSATRTGFSKIQAGNDHHSTALGQINASLEAIEQRLAMQNAAIHELVTRVERLEGNQSTQGRSTSMSTLT